MNFLRFVLPMALLLISNNVFSQVGSLDLGFSEDGYIRTSIGLSGSIGTCVALQPDGKILFGGPCWWPDNDFDFSIGRLLPNGDYDNTFSNDGRIQLDLGSKLDYLKQMAVRPSGKITTFGLSYILNPFSSSFALVQFNSDGTVDSTFGTDGVVKSQFTGYDNPVQMQIQEDGKIVTAGYAQVGQNDIMILARYLANGEFDTTFNHSGIVYDQILNLGTRLTDIYIQTDGKIVATGYVVVDGNFDYIMRRYHVNGQLDTTFGVAGLVRGDFANHMTTQINNLIILPNKKILVSGTNNFDYSQILSRFNEDGSLDTSFGVNGVSTISIPGFLIGLGAFTVLSDGKVLITGGIQKNDYTEHNYFVARMFENGSFDQSFGIDGLQQVSTIPDGDNAFEDGRAIAVQPDGKIILVGISDYQSFVSRHLTELHVGLLDFTAEAVAPLIYPNPIVETATLQYELSEATTITVELYDLQGKRMLTLLPETEQAEGKHELPILLPSHLASGAYVLSVSNGKGRVAVQVIKQ